MTRTLLSSVWEYKKGTILAPICVTLEPILEIMVPTIMAFLIDNGINQEDMSYVLKMGLVLILAAVLSPVTGILAGRNAAVVSAGFTRDLRHDIFYNVQNFSFSNIDKFSTVSIITRLTTDVTNVQNVYRMLVRLAVRAPMMIVFALMFPFRIDAQLSLIFLAIIPVLGLGMFVIMSRVHPTFVRVFRTYDRLNNIVRENLYGIRVVKSHIREDSEEKKFVDASQTVFNDFTRAEKRLAFTMPLMQLCLYASMLLLSWSGAQEIVTSGNNAAIGLSAGELVSLITYAMQILMSLMMLSMVFVMIIISRASAERIVEVMTEESNLKNSENPVYSVPNGSITFEDITLSYARQTDKPVFDDITFSIALGQTVGIIGGTDSSKSSLVRLIPRLYDPMDGVVTVGGVNVEDYDLETLRSEVAMVLQKNVLFPSTIEENLRWGNEKVTDEEMIRACQLAQAGGFIREFPGGYDTYIERGSTNVSGGQRQRSCVARALLKQSKILILDDSTSAVDTKADSLIRQTFREDIPNTTKIIIAQRVSSVQNADKIIALDDGRINAIDTYEQLLETYAIYREVYESQNKGGTLHE